MQQDIRLGVVLPVHALHLKVHAVARLDGQAVVYGFKALAPVAFHPALLHQASTDAAGAKPLGEQQVG